MNIEVTHNKALIKELMRDIWDQISQDGDEYNNFEPRCDSLNGWLIVNDYDKIKGIVFIEQQTLSSIQIHPYLVGEKGIGREIVKAVLDWAKDIDSIYKVNVSIADIYSSTINTAKKIGFVEEGLNRQSFLKNGEYRDQVLLGLTRPEIEAILCQ